MLCSISGLVPEEPVVSRLNGSLYERRLIEKYIAEQGKCPKTGEPMRKEDLILVAGGAPVTSRPPGVTSIPGLLQMLHSEWDALMLEQFSLRQQLQAAHQELGQALFQYDAGCRVIAKLIKERDELKAQLISRDAGSANGGGTTKGSRGARGHDDGADGGGDSGRDDEEEEDEEPALPPAIIEDLEAHETRLKAERKRREVPRATATAQDLRAFVESDKHEAHGAAVAVNAVATVAAGCGRAGGADSTALLSGGSDGKIMVYDVARRAVAGILVGHTKAVRRIVAANDLVVTCSDDGSTRLWQSEGGSYRQASVMKTHRGGVADVALFPSNRHTLSVGATDGQVMFSDIQAGLSIASGKHPEAGASLTCVALHPDGPLAATGSGSSVFLWNVKIMDVEVALPQERNTGSVTSVAFAEDGYSMAVGMSSGVVRVWDLRQMREAPVQFGGGRGSAGELSATKSAAVSRVSFDPSAQFLAAASHEVSVWDLKGRSQLASFRSHMMPVTDVAWGWNSQWLASGSLDCHVAVYRAAGVRTH